MSPTCTCLSGDLFDACCGPFLAGTTHAPTAERLMRSRYTAFAVRDHEYLLRTWHPATRPDELTLDDEQRWYRLDIDDTSSGGLLDSDGVVAFSAFYRHPDGNGVLHERSRFVREHGHWLYLDGVLSP
ncbi:MAG: YchJ family protein [Rhodococcus fascians]